MKLRARRIMLLSLLGGTGVLLIGSAVSLWWIIGFEDYCAISCGNLIAYAELPRLISRWAPSTRNAPGRPVSPR